MPTSVRIAASNTGQSINYGDIVYTLATDVDFRDKQCIIRYYVHEGNEGESDHYLHIKSVGFYLWDTDDSGGGGVPAFKLTNLQINTTQAFPFNYPGWHEVAFTYDNVNTAGNLQHADDLILRVQCDTLGEGGDDVDPAITFDSLRFVELPEVGYGIVTFDGWYEDDYRTAAYLSSKGIRGVFYGDPLRGGYGTAGHLTLQQLHDMQQAGHVIALYTDFTNKFRDENGENPLTPAQALAQILAEQRWFYDNGFSEGARHIALSGGSFRWPEGFDEEVIGRYFDTIRFTLNGDVNERQGIYNLSQLLTNSFMEDEDFDISDALNQITVAGDQKGMFCVGIHSNEVQVEITK